MVTNAPRQFGVFVTLVGCVVCLFPHLALASPTGGQIQAVGAESQYANIIHQIGGDQVSVEAIMDNPNADPHSFEVSPAVVRAVGNAQLVVQNGDGYDGFMTKIEAATSGSHRRVLSVATLIPSGSSADNPHFWYRPRYVEKVAGQISVILSKIRPSEKNYFNKRLQRFRQVSRTVFVAINQIRVEFHDVGAATTEPVADYLLQTLEINNKTSWTLQAEVMNGVDPSPQDIAREELLFSEHRVRLFVYNDQVTESLTQNFLSLAKQSHIPIVGVNETMAVKTSYQRWILGVLNSIKSALHKTMPARSSS
jgi:zinc/manganese transport system substrate-binding protein